MYMLNNWKNVKFESSSGLTPQFASFDKDFRRYLIETFVKHGFKVAGYNRGHFCISGFLQNTTTGKIVYFSLSDVRYFGGWYDDVLVRTAKNNKDYTGGQNNRCTLDNMYQACIDLTA